MSLLSFSPSAVRRLSPAEPGHLPEGARGAPRRRRPSARRAPRPFAGTVVVLAVGGLLAACSSGGEITVRDAWIRLTDPSRPLGGFMTIANAGPTDDALVGVESSAFETIELHETVPTESGAAPMPSGHDMGHDMSSPMASGGTAMTMRPVEAIPIPAGGEQVLQPGGYHLMLMSPKQTLAVGDLVELTLRFRSGRTLTIQVPLRAP